MRTARAKGLSRAVLFKHASHAILPFITIAGLDILFLLRSWSRVRSPAGMGRLFGNTQRGDYPLYGRAFAHFHRGLLYHRGCVVYSHRPAHSAQQAVPSGNILRRKDSSVFAPGMPEIPPADCRRLAKPTVSS
jgi:hypothetical protein